MFKRVFKNIRNSYSKIIAQNLLVQKGVITLVQILLQKNLVLNHDELTHVKLTHTPLGGSTRLSHFYGNVCSILRNALSI